MGRVANQARRVLSRTAPPSAEGVEPWRAKADELVRLVAHDIAVSDASRAELAAARAELSLADSRLVSLQKEVDRLRGTLLDLADSRSEGDLLTARALAQGNDIVAQGADRVSAGIEALAESVHRLDRRGAEEFSLALKSREALDPASMSAYVAAVANITAGNLGYASHEGLWVNTATVIEHADGEVRLTAVNERIVEIPYAFGALAALPPGSRILDVGCAESTVALSLATLGWQVTAVDPRGYPYAHPTLDVVTGYVSDLPDKPNFDAVLLLSTIEHIGIGAYGETIVEDADRVLMADALRRLKPGGLVVLTTPVAQQFHEDELQRYYDTERLGQLLEGVDVSDQTFLRQSSATCWEVVADVSRDGRHVVMLSGHVPRKS